MPKRGACACVTRSVADAVMIELSTRLREISQRMDKLLKALTVKNLLRHYAKRVYKQKHGA